MKKAVSILATTGSVICGWVLYANVVVQRPHPVSESVEHGVFDSALIDPQIKNAERVVREDPGGALGFSYLSSAYMRRSRESDNLESAVKAEWAARRSLQIRKLGNSSSWNKLVQALLQQHRFKDALAQCDEALQTGVYDDQTICLRAECLIEIGKYDEARRLIATSRRAFDTISGNAVSAKLADILGHPDVSLELLKKACHTADQSAGIPGDALAWFHVRVADQEARMGQHERARSEYTNALHYYPRDYKAPAGLARLAFHESRWAEAIFWGIRSEEVASMADVRAMLGDSYANLGQFEQAETEYQKVATLIGRPSGMNDGLHEVTPGQGSHGHRLDRQYAMYCADHERDLEGGYAAAIRDFENRRDIYAFDTLAWISFKRGNLSEARSSIRRALATGSKDPLLYYHAGMILFKSGERKAGRNFLAQAIKIDPRFDDQSVRHIINLDASLSTRESA